MTDIVALKPTLFFCHDRANAQFILGTHQGRTVVVRMAIPEINGTQDEAFEVIFEGDEAGAMAKLNEIIHPPGPRLAA